MRKKLVIIGASEQQLPLILKAKEKGYETHVFAWSCGDVGEYIADKFYPISIVDKERILEVCKTIKPIGIISIASDLAVNTINYIADNMGLVGNPVEDTLVTTNKFLMRERLKKYRVKCPNYIKTNNSNIEVNLSYPLIVKPTDRSGSRGVYKVEEKGDLKKAIERAIKQSFSKEAIIEEYIVGKEYSVEFISQNGTHKFLAITEKFTNGAPNFVEIGHIQPANINSKHLDTIKKVINKSLNALNISNGASHSEIMLTKEGDIYIIEIGARMGGDYIGADLVEISTGFDFVNAVIDISVGNSIEKANKETKNIGVSRYIINKEDKELLESIKRNNSHDIHRIGNIEEFDGRVVDDSSKKYGFYILKTKDEELVKKVFSFK